MDVFVNSARGYLELTVGGGEEKGRGDFLLGGGVGGGGRVAS